MDKGTSGPVCLWGTAMCAGIIIAVLFALPSVGIAAEPQFVQRDDLFGVYFVGTDEGWACGRWGSILHTANGGKSWQRQVSGTEFTLSDIYFVDSRSGWAVGNGGTILHTEDAGRTWSKQESPVPYFHSGVCFAGPLNGWISSEQSHILHTEDGGRTWKVQFSDDVQRLKSIFFCDARQGWAVGEFGFVYGTSDGGNTWQHQDGFFRLNEETTSVEAGVFLFDAVALDDHTVIAVGADGVVAETEDGGKTWDRRFMAQIGEAFFGIAYDGKETLVVTGKGHYLYSKDRGKTWLPISFDPSMEYSWLYRVCRRGEVGFAAVGEDGAICLSGSSNVWSRVHY